MIYTLHSSSRYFLRVSTILENVSVDGTDTARCGRDVSMKQCYSSMHPSTSKGPAKAGRILKKKKKPSICLEVLARTSD